MATYNFPPTSRYYGVETASLTTSDGRHVTYLRRRFVPAPERFAVLLEHVVEEGDRLDNVTARYLGDPEAYWRVADANRGMRPAELTETVGRRLLITLPEGIPGPSNA
ncbi:MAG: LysM domain-containing protein [Bryobacteraceae bacterium]